MQNKYKSYISFNIHHACEQQSGMIVGVQAVACLW